MVAEPPPTKLISELTTSYHATTNWTNPSNRRFGEERCWVDTTTRRVPRTTRRHTTTDADRVHGAPAVPRTSERGPETLPNYFLRQDKFLRKDKNRQKGEHDNTTQRDPPFIGFLAKERILPTWIESRPTRNLPQPATDAPTPPPAPVVSCIANDRRLPSRPVLAVLYDVDIWMSENVQEGRASLSPKK